jgi:hypothetical protein
MNLAKNNFKEGGRGRSVPRHDRAESGTGQPHYAGMDVDPNRRHGNRPFLVFRGYDPDPAGPGF